VQETGSISIVRTPGSRRRAAPAVDEILGENSIQDSALRMMFSCCHPRLSEAAQVALILNILRGFSVDEIASAFTNGGAAIEKRIVRGKKVLAGSKRLFDTAAHGDFSDRQTCCSERHHCSQCVGGWCLAERMLEQGRNEAYRLRCTAPSGPRLWATRLHCVR
jgi:hypothetical protein